ncbi:protein-tyrosine-phosphatase [Marmoricola endophyticus]|uniref:protein-tyrosine-phosphatase n=1 Tax=Marmoricola endophyticus TaxID=2040280 RepID=A0A917F346_9ACTN|nr:low molecular weight protein-tyrosine-phosphatase [Marmoricola endophyticus]GGF46133.1 protein-tyrosine-phosphatase [Marmoricola endophyticus]
MTASLPTAREPGTAYRIGTVCLGNICRSPMAATVLGELVDRAGLADRVEVSSCGTGGWHVGQPMDERAASTLRAADYDGSDHRAQQLGPGWLAYDLLLAMDEDNLAGVHALAGEVDPARVRLFRDFDPVGPGEVPDPYYGGPQGFADVLAMVERTGVAIVAALERM